MTLQYRRFTRLCFVHLFLIFLIVTLPVVVCANDITLVNITDSIAMEVLKIPEDPKKPPIHIGYIAAKSPNNSGSLIVSGSVGDRYMIKNGSNNGIIDIIEVIPTRLDFKNNNSHYFYRTGDHHWIEYSSKKGESFKFKQLAVDNGFIRLYDPSRHLELSLPVKGGQCRTRYPAESLEWQERPNCDLVPSRVKQTIHIGWNNIPVRDLRPGPGYLPNVDPSLFAYDLWKIDPIDRKGGMKRAIFKRLEMSSTKYDVVDGDYIVPHGIVYMTNNGGEGGLFSKMVYNSTQLRESWNIGIKVKVGDTKGKKPKTPAAGSVSFSYSEMKKQDAGNRSYYSVSRKTINKYTIKPVLGVIEVTSAFAEAVMDLPLPIVTKPKTPADFKADPGFSSYKNFVKTWGSHYPSEIQYGGAIYYTRQYDKDTISKVKSSEWKAKAEGEAAIKGIPIKIGVEGGESKSSGFSKSTKTEKGKYWFVGGEGGPGGFTVGEDVEPIGIVFSPITDILHPFYFMNGSTYADLNPRRDMLIEAIDASYPANGPGPLEPQIKVYDLETLYMTTTSDGAPQIYGKVITAAIGGLESISIDKGTTYIFKRSDKGGSRVIFREGFQLKIPNNKRLVLGPGQNMESGTFFVGGDLNNWHGILPAELKSNSKEITFKDMEIEKPLMGIWTEDKISIPFNDFTVEIHFRYRQTPRLMIDPSEWDRLMKLAQK